MTYEKSACENSDDYEIDVCKKIIRKTEKKIKQTK